MNIEFVPADDREFLAALYASTREAELAQVAWPPAAKSAFLRSQFDAQDEHYKTYYQGASFQIVVVDGEQAGRLYVARGAEEIRIVDIAFMPSFRGRGLGTKLIEALIAEARTKGLPLRMHVEVFNPARRLYERLGFKEIENKGVYLFLEVR